ncbi:hypothetical protein AAVH_03853 [Aphelenchoides avenae]|nr:hypothetical protein AAVH_03853 [Aphelenchus avenae]
MGFLSFLLISSIVVLLVGLFLNKEQAYAFVHDYAPGTNSQNGTTRVERTRVVELRSNAATATAGCTTVR